MVDLRSLPPDLQARYGVRRRPRWVAPLIIAIAVLVGVGLTALGWTLANPEVRWKLLTWDAVAADHTRVTFEVRRDGADEVTCIVRVADGNAQDVAYAPIVIAPGDDYVQPTYDIRTRAPGRVVDLLGCAAGGAPPVPGPEFPPGTQNPPQPWSTEGQP
ncbi:MAG: DUF4307 domain-containing protein [Actinobacteria bacterium]|nr:MAG: DUF4307 domain-containing protein [Actinomycetota bacterium]